MEDFIKDLKFQVYDRLKSPLITTFCFSWISWNISTVILIFGKGDFDKKIEMVKRLYKTNYDYFLQGLIYPFLSSLVFIGLYPLIARWTFIYWSNQLKITKREQIKIEDTTPITQEDYQNLKKSYYLAEKTYETELERLQNANKTLKEREKSLELEINQLIDKEKTIIQELSKLKEDNLALKKELDEKMKRISEQDTLIGQHQKLNVEMLRDNLDNKQMILDIDKFIMELGVKTDGLPREYIDFFKNLKQFKESNNIKFDELKVITYLLSQDGAASKQKLQEFLNIKSINFEVVLKKLFSSDLAYSDSLNVHLSSKCKEKAYDANLTRVEATTLKEIVQRFRN
ncbi:coiled-coil domain-containing protein [Methylophilus methylotrophus]|uniref:coiled-coil domain-containing protein n=1 Tax=Methylophilus methylotrophus TaxID=17 RepID=UPI0003817549|nr:hypothetical protein [Methylophilus methylotrophus]